MEAIELADLTKSFGNRVAVESLDLTVHPGDIFGFVGPNGSGKTTTIRMIAGLLRPTRGEVFIYGDSVQKSQAEVKRRIGYMPEGFGTYPDLKVWEYLDFFSACYGIGEPRRTILIDELLELVELSSRREDRVDRLSRGVKQRLSLARTLLHDPLVLVLDEPAAGLDPRARIEIRALLVELARMGKTIFFSTHILSDVAEICTQIGIIEAGNLITSGRVEDIQLQVLPRRRIRMTILDRVSEALELLQGHPAVEAVENQIGDNHQARFHLAFEFEGNDGSLSELLHQLVDARIPILHFSEEERDLEEVFLRTTRGIIS